MWKNKNYITALLEAPPGEGYRIWKELEQKLQSGFNPEEAQDFVEELLKLVYYYKMYKKSHDALAEFAEIIADFLPYRFFDRT